MRPRPVVGLLDEFVGQFDRFDEPTIAPAAVDEETTEVL
jgi:hypothetical protein